MLVVEWFQDVVEECFCANGGEVVGDVDSADDGFYYI